MQAVAKASLTLVVGNQSMNHYDKVPTLTDHYTGFVNGDNAGNSGIVASVSLSTTASSMSFAGYYPIQAAVNSFSAPNYTLGSVQTGTMTVKPKIMDVRVDFGHRTMSLINLSRDLPFINIQAIDVIFSDNVAVSSSMLDLLGVIIPSYSFKSFTYNSGNFDATWFLKPAINIDRLALNLSGESAPPVTGPGPNIPVKPFSDKFAVLPGDVDGDGTVTNKDLKQVQKVMRSHRYSIWADVDGNGVVNNADYNDVRRRLGKHLP